MLLVAPSSLPLLLFSLSGTVKKPTSLDLQWILVWCWNNETKKMAIDPSGLGLATLGPSSHTFKLSPQLLFMLAACTVEVRCQPKWAPVLTEFSKWHVVPHAKKYRIFSLSPELRNLESDRLRKGMGGPPVFSGITTVWQPRECFFPPLVLFYGCQCVRRLCVDVCVRLWGGWGCVAALCSEVR